MGTYPTDIRPGMGLPEYYMFVHMADPSLGIARLRRDRPLPPPDNVRLVRLPYPDAAISNASGLRRLWAFFFKTFGYITFWLLSLPYMLLFRPKIVHIHSPMPMLHGLFGKYVLRAKFFITFHGTDVNHLPRSRILRALVRRADMVCYVSTAMQKAVEDAVPPERLLYTPNGVDTAAFPPGNDDRAPRVLMVGSLRWQKGYPDALAAFARFKEHRPDWGLDIVGVGTQTQNALDVLQLRLIHRLFRQFRNQAIDFAVDEILLWRALPYLPRSIAAGIHVVEHLFFLEGIHAAEEAVVLFAVQAIFSDQPIEGLANEFLAGADITKDLAL